MPILRPVDLGSGFRLRAASRASFPERPPDEGPTRFLLAYRGTAAPACLDVHRGTPVSFFESPAGDRARSMRAACPMVPWPLSHRFPLPSATLDRDSQGFSLPIAFSSAIWPVYPCLPLSGSFFNSPQVGRARCSRADCLDTDVAPHRPSFGFDLAIFGSGFLPAYHSFRNGRLAYRCILGRCLLQVPGKLGRVCFRRSLSKRLRCRSASPPSRFRPSSGGREFSRIARFCHRVGPAYPRALERHLSSSHQQVVRARFLGSILTTRRGRRRVVRRIIVSIATLVNKKMHKFAKFLFSVTNLKYLDDIGFALSGWLFEALRSSVYDKKPRLVPRPSTPETCGRRNVFGWRFFHAWVEKPL